MSVDPGVNIAPGSQDDGWAEPPPVALPDGTRVRLYKDGQALAAAFEAIENARREVLLEVYIFAGDRTGQAFADLLATKARQGVRVRVVYDSFGSNATPRSLFRTMAKAGVVVREFHPIRPWDCIYSYRPVNRDHRKLLIIDRQAGGLGGLNVGAEYAGSWVVHRPPEERSEFWRDTAVGVTGPAVAVLTAAFLATWNYVGRGGRIGKAALTHLPRDEGTFGLMATVPTRDSPLLPELHMLLGAARHSVRLTMAYFAPDDPPIDALCDAALRGCRVQLMLPGRCDVKLLLVAARSFYSRLMAAGVEIFERQAVVLHAKTLVIDSRLAVVGSTNLDYRSIEYNLELSAVIHSPEFAAHLDSLFDNDIRYAVRIRPDQWRRRPWTDRLGQWAVSRARYLL